MPVEITTMTSALELLSARIKRSIARHPEDGHGVILPLPRFNALSGTAESVAQKFEPGKEPEPSTKQRREAIARLRLNNPNLSNKDWKLISWGLSDSCETTVCLLEDELLFNKIDNYLAEQIKTAQLSRRVWFGLNFSYFAYGIDDPKSNPNWLCLQQHIYSGFKVLKKQQMREHAWVSMMSNNLELFTPNAGKLLGQAMFQGDAEQINAVQTYLPVPENSWLWRSIIRELLRALFKAKDTEFRPRIVAMLELATQHNRYADEILAVILTRYAGSGFRDESHTELKEYALAKWGSPQIKTTKNRWTAHVEDDVCKMVLRWFAKEDLEHFFKLLQGEHGVDQARLDYWLPYVDQMNYTRIVMGLDATNDRSPDFIEFRQKNRARLSRLTSGPPDNNAFIMQIGDYYFVEFSGIGNACYIYHQEQLPFNPDSQALELNTLKQMAIVKKRLLHMSGWERKADAILASIGIFQNSGGKSKTITRPTVPLPTWLENPEKHRAPVSTASKVVKPQSKAPTNSVVKAPISKDHHVPKDEARELKINAKNIKTNIAIDNALLLFSDLLIRLNTQDHRSKGGAYWILLKDAPTELDKNLRNLGFHYIPSKGYWIQ